LAAWLHSFLLSLVSNAMVVRILVAFMLMSGLGVQIASGDAAVKDEGKNEADHDKDRVEAVQ